jgi:hypothetical protein
MSEYDYSTHICVKGVTQIDGKDSIVREEALIGFLKCNPTKEDILGEVYRDQFLSEDGSLLLLLNSCNVSNMLYFPSWFLGKKVKISLRLSADRRDQPRQKEQILDFEEIDIPEDEFDAYHLGIDLYKRICSKAVEYFRSNL